jgi:hypothetical protein
VRAARGMALARSEYVSGVVHRGLRAVVRRGGPVNTSLSRWGSIAALAVIGAMEFEVLLPLALVYWNKLWIPPWTSPWFVAALTFVVSVALLRIAMDPIRIHTSQFRYMHKYPPLMVAVLGAVAGAVGLELLPLHLRPNRLSLHWWEDGIWLALSGMVALSVLRVPRRTRTLAGDPQFTASNGDDISRWARTERPIFSPAEDKLRHIEIAQRLVTRLSSDVDQSVALLGPFGSGKTSILNLARGLPPTPTDTRLWYVQVNCWGLETSASARRPPILSSSSL